MTAISLGRLARGARACAAPKLRHDRRWLCVVPKEQSEVGIDPKTPTKHRPHELLAKQDSKVSTKRYLMGGGGAVLAYGGVSLVAYNHWAWLAPMMPDAIGLSALTLGCGLATAAMRTGDKGSSKSSKAEFEYEFELVPLNDELRYKATLGSLGGGDADASSSFMSAGSSSGAEKTKGGSSLHPELSAALVKVEKEESEAAEAAKTAATSALVEDLTSSLKSGELTPRRLYQKLRPRLFVIDFDTRPPIQVGRAPTRAPSTRELLDAFREKVNFLLHVVSPFDEVVLRVYSPGGSAADYGLAGAHFARLKQAGVSTTATVDLVAASGGYMIACAASRLIAAPFAIVGSIGVVATAPNVARLLDKQGVDVVQRTAGEYKRTLNIFTPNTPEGLAKFEEELQMVHDAFIAHVSEHRPVLDTGKVCTGETWLGMLHYAEAMALAAPQL